MFCAYKHIFGKEGEGAHKWRVFNIAIVDLALTVVLGFAISWYFHVNFALVLALLLLLGIIMHRLFCVNTTINKFIFGRV